VGKEGKHNPTTTHAGQTQCEESKTKDEDTVSSLRYPTQCDEGVDGCYPTQHNEEEGGRKECDPRRRRGGVGGRVQPNPMKQEGRKEYDPR